MGQDHGPPLLLEIEKTLLQRAHAPRLDGFPTADKPPAFPGDNQPSGALNVFMDEAHTGLGLVFLLLAFVVCGGVVIWLIVSEGIRHTRQSSDSSSHS